MDASIEEVGKVIGADLGGLSDGARRLTKGDLLALMGATTEDEAATVFLATGGLMLPKPRLTENTKGLTIADRASLGRAFGNYQSEVIGRIRTGPGISELKGGGAHAETVIKCCCCPCTCCCAVTVAKPARID